MLPAQHQTADRHSKAHVKTRLYILGIDNEGEDQFNSPYQNRHIVVLCLLEIQIDNDLPP